MDTEWNQNTTHRDVKGKARYITFKYRRTAMEWLWQTQKWEASSSSVASILFLIPLKAGWSLFSLLMAS